MDQKFDIKQIQWKWVGISIGIFLIAQFLLGIVFGVFGILTLGLGFLLFSWIVKPIIYFITGFVTGFVSPGITIWEPAIGALIVSLIGVLFFSAQHRGNLFTIVLSGGLAFVIALAGAYIGEKKSMDKTDDSDPV